MAFPALDDELHAPRSIAFGVLGADRLWCAVDDDVRAFEQVVERTCNIEARLAHGG